MWFEVLKGVKVEDKVEHKGETITIKQVLQKVEVNQKRIFVGIEKGLGKYKNDLLVIINKDRTDIGNKWIRENYGKSLNFLKDKQCDVSVPAKLSEKLNSVNEVEEHVEIELKKKSET